MKIAKTAVCSILFLLLLCSAVTGADQSAAIKKDWQVTKTIRMVGQITLMDLAGGFPMVLIDKGFASHLGVFFDVGKYTAPGEGFGMYIFSDGDQLFWEQRTSSEITFTGGTGRFKNASGSLTFTLSEGEYIPGPNGTMNYVCTYTGQGTITYRMGR